MSKVSIIGAGQCGSLLSISLARLGFDVDVFERFEDPRVYDAEAGRSINLALAARGIHGLKEAGLFELVEPLLVPMRGRAVHHVDGRVEFLPYGQSEDEKIFSVTRVGLNNVLLDAAEQSDRINFRFRHKAMGYDSLDGCVHMRDEDSGTLYEIDTQPVFAADGAGSVIRRSFDGYDTFGGVESLLRHGYKELSIPAGPDGQYQLRADALHIWPRGGFMLIALPNPGGDFTLTLFLANEGPDSFESLDSPSRVRRFFEEHFADAAPLISNLEDDLLNHPLGVLGTIRCRHWHDRGKILLIGDAAHAIVPFHGQGMNLAFEDVVLLDQLIKAHGDDWPNVFALYESEQLANASAIADMALDNYIEMRDTVRDPKFALRKALAFELEQRLPDYFIPRYSMVMFHADIPYLTAQQRGEVQHALLEEFTRDAETMDEVDIAAAADAAKKRLRPLAEVRIKLGRDRFTAA